MINPGGIRETGRDIYTANFADYLPGPLKHDPKMRAIAEAVTKEALTVSGEIENVLIYSRIDELPEELIDILAYDMHVDWYDYDYPINVKRDLVKNSVKVHKKKGTVCAVETAINTLYPGSKIEEWFEYNGLPYHFRLIVNLNNERTKVDINAVIKNINLYKRLAAHLEAIYLRRNKSVNIFLGCTRGVLIKKITGIEKVAGNLKNIKKLHVFTAKIERVSIIYN